MSDGAPVAVLPWIDTHVHWDAAEFDVDRDQTLQYARQVGISACLNPSVSIASMHKVQQLAESSQRRDDWPSILPAFGIHPLYVVSATEHDLAELDQQVTLHRPAAVGEIGLDGYADAPSMVLQRPLFEAQLSLAARHGLPVLLHLRHAVEEVILALKRVQGLQQKIPGGIAHAFNGSLQQAEQLMAMGFLLGFGGSLTFEGSTRIRRLATTLPLEYLALETDAPDMSPVWLGRTRNQSAELPRIAECLANLRGIPLAVLSEQTCANVRRLGLWP